MPIAQLQYKNQFNKNVKETIFEVGSKVLLFTPSNQMGVSFKVTPRFSGPYLIISRVGPHNYTLRNCLYMKTRGIVHGERLKMFYEGKPNLENFKLFRAEQTDIQIKDAIVPRSVTDRVHTGVLAQPQPPSAAETLIIPNGAPLLDNAASSEIKIFKRSLPTKIKKTSI